MEKLVVLIIILVAVLSTPLTLKKLIDQANRRKSELLGDSNAHLSDSNAQQNDSNAPSSKTYKTYDDDDDWPNKDDWPNDKRS